MPSEYTDLAMAMFDGTPCSYCGKPLHKEELYEAVGVAKGQGRYQTPIAHEACYREHNASSPAPARAGRVLK